MEAIAVFAIVVAAFMVLDLAAFAFGRDSREMVETRQAILR